MHDQFLISLRNTPLGTPSPKRLDAVLFGADTADIATADDAVADAADDAPILYS